MNPNVPDPAARKPMNRPRTRLLTLLALGSVLLVPAWPAHAAGTPEPRRLTREIGVMEKTIDEMLLDSTNLLVYSAQNNAKGIYLDEYGVIFSFTVSLVERAGTDHVYRFKDFKIEDSGDKIVIRRDTKESDSQDDDEKAAPPPGKKEAMKALRARQAEQYAAGRREMVDVLLDYGTTMTLLRDTQQIAIAVLLKDTEYFRERHISRLTLSVRVGDLRAFSAGRLSREEIQKKVREEEY